MECLILVKTLAETIGTAAHITGASFESLRILRADHGLGYSLHDTLCKAGSVQHLHYQNHIETNYVIEGMGEVEDVCTGQIYS